MKSYGCPICKEMVNTFQVDYDGWKAIWLCLKCAKKEGFEVDLNPRYTRKCRTCGKLFRPPKSFAYVCTPCWINAQPKKKVILASRMQTSQLPFQKELMEVKNGRN